MTRPVHGVGRAAILASGRRVGAIRTTCDLIYVYRLRPEAGEPVDPDTAEVDATLRRLRDALQRAQARIGAALAAAPDAAGSADR